MSWFTKRDTHQHDFDAWVVTQRYAVAAKTLSFTTQAIDETWPVVGSGLEQERRCKTCGFTELHRQIVRIDQ